MTSKLWTRQELFDLVWTTPLSTICREHKLKLTQLQKICRDLVIPLPPNGHWSKLRFGKADPKPSLPQITNEEKEMEVNIPQSTEPSPEILARRALLKVPERLTNPDPLVEAARKSLEARAKETRDNRLLWTGHDELDIQVSKSHIPKALRVMDTIIKFLKASHWTIRTTYKETRAEKREVSLRIAFRETTKRVSVGGWPPNEATGKLVFKFDGFGSGECRINDPLETDRLLRVLDKMESIVIELNKIWEESRKRETERQAVIQAGLDAIARQQKELDDFRNLLNEAHRWQGAEMIRNYVQANKEKDDTWTEWAMKKADWFDPLKNAEDDLLAGADKNTLTLASK